MASFFLTWLPFVRAKVFLDAVHALPLKHTIMVSQARTEAAAKRKRQAPVSAASKDKDSSLVPEEDILGDLDHASLELGQDEAEGSEDGDLDSDAELDPFPEIDAQSSGSEGKSINGAVHATEHVVSGGEDEDGDVDDDDEGYDSEDIDNWDESEEDGACN